MIELTVLDVQYLILGLEPYNCFSYSEIVKRIYYDQIIEDPVIKGNFADLERNSIYELIRLLRECSEIGGEVENIDND